MITLTEITEASKHNKAEFLNREISIIIIILDLLHYLEYGIYPGP